ncbi:hypothetical protein [Natronorubrum halophilum]|uniref:hypothetical protein n=1 Tax=Natronorubrum halophilum TaxID=1702106 RepID=UPI0010C23094|nr:hypothetical protein [Natronorubrum halophilum]
MEALEAESDQDLTLPRTAESFVDPIETTTDRGYTDWYVGQEMVPGVHSVGLTPKTLSFSFEIGRDRLEHWRQFDRSGNVRVKAGFAGSFQTIDRAGREEPTTLEPPFRQRPPFDEADYYINSYQESQQGPDRYRISLTFQRLANRADVFDPVDESGEPWLLEFEGGTIALEERHVRQGRTGGSTTGRTMTLPLMLSDLQAATIADIAGFPDGVVQREVPDGENFQEDTTGGRQTVAIDAPSDAGFESGAYLISNWQLSFAGYQDDRWRVELELAEE